MRICVRGKDVQLTNRFHVAVRLFSNRSQMTSKCGKNKKVAHEAIAECVQLAVSDSELYFPRCCALKRTGTFATESKVNLFILTDFKK